MQQQLNALSISPIMGGGLHYQSGAKSIVITAMGGDGTFMFLAQDAYNEGISLDDGTISFCILPFGTGNDLA
jgi:diacylglycerol kinase family enzyme